jgi:hypothetical protein
VSPLHAEPHDQERRAITDRTRAIMPVSLYGQPAEMVAIADLSIGDLIKARNNGTVRNLKDRRHDLYSVVWKSK